MRSTALIAISLCGAACSFDTSAPLAGGGAGADAGVGGADAAPTPDAATGEKDHLLLSEVKTTGGGKEFVELYNPTSRTIALDDYYLADTKDYALLPGATGGGPPPEVTNNDFIARFPAGASMASGETIVVAIRPTAFNITFGVSPDYRIGGEPDGVSMETAYTGSIGSLASLTDNGEAIALFEWDGASDLVTDIDLVDVGPITSEQNRLANKSGLRVDGPDDGREESTYQDDGFTMTYIGEALEFGEAFHRILPETGHEVHNGNGNGVDGHDETTEDLATTWDRATATPGTPAEGL